MSNSYKRIIYNFLILKQRKQTVPSPERSVSGNTTRARS